MRKSDAHVMSYEILREGRKTNLKYKGFENLTHVKQRKDQVIREEDKIQEYCQTWYKQLNPTDQNAAIPNQ